MIDEYYSHLDHDFKTGEMNNQSWDNMPRIKCLRKYFSSRKASKRSGSHGMVYYDAVTDEYMLAKIQELEQIDKKDRPIIQSLKDRVMQRIQAKIETTVLQHTPDWVSEEDGISILRQRWNHLPIKRVLREFMQEKQALKHVGKHWAVCYDAVFLKGLIEQYEPLADHNIDIRNRSLLPLLSGYKLESIGYLKLIKQAELVALLKAIGNRDRILASARTRKGCLQKLAKVKSAQTASTSRYEAIT